MSSTITSVVAATTSTAPKVADQTGIIGGANPQHYNKNDPIVVFIVQVFIIVTLCRLLHLPLSKIRQPRVIAEVIGGIILGPTVMGRVPNFTTTIFPQEAMPNLNLVANLGLVLFLFLIGLEVDFRIMVENWRIALGVGSMGIALPFGLGAAISYGLYNEFGSDVGVNQNVNFGVFLLFVGVAFSITAFPVLCRILTELRLLGTNVGVIVLAAGSGDDVVGWILLALTVALVNAGTGITALYVLLVAIGYISFLFLAIKPAFHWYLRKTGNLKNPSQGALTVTLLLCLASAWFANVIGIHAIFGGLVVGLICPRDGGFAPAVAEKIEDLVTVLFLPLYFTLSGLRTNIGLLNSGIVWGYVFGVLLVAFFAKLTGAALAARLFKLQWRESLAVGALMQCKGLVELIVLNIGLTAGIISQRVFTIFVVMALVTTFATTPLVSFLYPEWYQKKCLAWRAGKINWDGTSTGASDDTDTQEPKVKTTVNKLTALLRLESLPSLMALILLLKGEKEAAAPAVHRSKTSKAGKDAPEPAKNEDGPAVKSRPLGPRFEVHGLRLRELDERTSAVMRVTEDSEPARDPVINFFKAFGRMNSMACVTNLAVIPGDSFSSALSDRAKDASSDLVVVPWSETGNLSDDYTYEETPDSRNQRFEPGPYVNFVSSLIQNTASSVALFINRGFGGVGGIDISERRPKRRGSIISGAISRVKSGIEEPTLPILDLSHHVFFPFISGADDRAALRFVLQLVNNNINVTATVVQVVQNSTSAAQTSTSSSTAAQNDAAFYLQIAASLPDEIAARVVFETLETEQPIQTIVTRAKQEVGIIPDAGDLVVVGRSHIENYDSQIAGVTLETAPSVSIDARKTVGSVATSIIVSQVKASVLVYHSSQSGSSL
ncbi:K(+)/H(+) antiporter [Orbilia oligospora]|uniref:K(+)/H(+) antiporter n=1 Tax=Orbilia oligospora TaxID=2813651 RepID=A0A7C8PUS2_ORBOL|nr:K(+)/H(+) antiporter [Orbilia oligospora]TGJ70590.1 K(+)/H(+) antiporter [Orbilia oligospora]